MMKQIFNLCLELCMILAYYQLWAPAGAHLHELPVDQKEGN
jgi:hypothetical protein